VSQPLNATKYRAFPPARPCPTGSLSRNPTRLVCQATLGQEEDPLRTKEVLELSEEFGKGCAYVKHEQVS
jgi:hypothetical protein